MTLKVLHTSDLHLGMKFAGYPEVQAHLVQARFDTLSRLVEIGNNEGCNLFVIAGDLFESPSVPKRRVIETAGILSSFHGLVVVLPGNHDFVSPSSELWSTFKEYGGDNTLVVDEERPYDLITYDLGVKIYPAPCHAKRSRENRIGWIKKEPKDRERINIGIAHGSLEGVSLDFDKDFYPMTVKELTDCTMDLWLLGHTHIPYPSQSGSNHQIFYAGTHEPDGFDYEGEGRVWIIEVNGENGIKARSVETGRYRFLHEEETVNNGEDLERLKKKYSSPIYRRVLLKLSLKGRLPREEYSRIGEMMDFISEQVFHLAWLDTGGLREEITREIIEQEFTEGSFPYLLLTSLFESGDMEALQMAYDMIQDLKR